MSTVAPAETDVRDEVEMLQESARATTWYWIESGALAGCKASENPWRAAL